MPRQTPRVKKSRTSKRRLREFQDLQDRITVLEFNLKNTQEQRNAAEAACERLNDALTRLKQDTDARDIRNINEIGRLRRLDSNRVRVLRLVEYTGPREAVEEQIKMAVHGTRRGTIDRETGEHVMITAVTINEYPEKLMMARQIDATPPAALIDAIRRLVRVDDAGNPVPKDPRTQVTEGKKGPLLAGQDAKDFLKDFLQDQ